MTLRSSWPSPIWPLPSCSSEAFILQLVEPRRLACSFARARTGAHRIIESAGYRVLPTPGTPSLGWSPFNWVATNATTVNRRSHLFVISGLSRQRHCDVHDMGSDIIPGVRQTADHVAVGEIPVGFLQGHFPSLDKVT